MILLPWLFCHCSSTPETFGDDGILLSDQGSDKGITVDPGSQPDPGSESDPGPQPDPGMFPDPGPKPDPGVPQDSFSPEDTIEDTTEDTTTEPFDFGTPPEAVTCPEASDESPDFAVLPFLQLATPDSIWIVWETSSGEESRVDWGPTEDLGWTVCGTAKTGFLESRIHEAQIIGLQPNMRFYYRVQTGQSQSEIYDFVTPPLPESESSFRFVAMSDIQFDWAHPTKYEEIVELGVIPYVSETYGPDIPKELSLALIPGDLVENGALYFQWASHFFGPGETLMAHIPFYPVPGNHEYDSEFFFEYFHLPENGSPGYLEHWWTHDYSNVRFIGLDSNGSYRIQTQLDWLDEVLESTCDDERIDFVFAELHHPHKSELWVPGEINFTGDVISRLEAFSSECGKPSIHFFGHTHGYSRGQSRDHNHLWVNVATAGGNIDYWGEYSQTDYDEFTVSLDEYGFVILDVEAGDDPKFELTRVSRGDGDETIENEVRDSITVRVNNQGPAAPSGLSPGGSLGCLFALNLDASEYSDPDGDPHGASHWQISTDCDTFSSIAFESWRQHENWFGDENTQANDDLTNEVATGLQTGQEYCWRVRYRDQSLAWSAWSEPQSFSLEASTQTGNLLSNPGAEEGTDSWTQTEGYLESVTDGECNGIEPYAGERYFVVGGICNHADYAEAFQRIQVPDSMVSAVELGNAVVSYGGYINTWSGYDEPAFKLIFYDQDLNLIGETSPTISQETEWTYVLETNPIPSNSRTIDMVLMGTHGAGSDTDCYFDDLELSIQSCVAE